jgi:hypothetical protein
MRVTLIWVYYETMKKITLTLTLFSLISFSTAFAQKDSGKMEFSADRKTVFLKNIDKRIADLQAHKACVEKANDVPAINECHTKFRPERKEIREDKMGNRGDKMEKSAEKDKEGMEKRKGGMEKRKAKVETRVKSKVENDTQE